MSNPHWVCLTSAIVADGKITIDYRSDGAKFNLHGVHLHIYGGDGTAPQARIMGRQVPESEQGNWYNESHRPAVLPVDDERFISSIGDARKVCARIGDAKHMLVPDENGTYVTGNCVPITRTGSATTTAPPDGDNGGNGNGNNAPDTWDRRPRSRPPPRRRRPRRTSRPRTSPRCPPPEGSVARAGCSLERPAFARLRALTRRLPGTRLAVVGERSVRRRDGRRQRTSRG